MCLKILNREFVFRGRLLVAVPLSLPSAKESKKHVNCGKYGMTCN